MKTIFLVLIGTVIIFNSILAQEDSTKTAKIDYTISCTNTQKTGTDASAIGNTTIASGDYSLASGYLSTASGYASAALGFQTNALNSHSIVFGSYAEALGLYNCIIGSSSYTTSDFAMSFGHYLKSSANYAFTIGKGYSSTEPLENNNPNSLMIGFGSTVPTFYVGGATSPSTFGRVGIGTTAPATTLDVNGTFRVKNQITFTGLAGTGNRMVVASSAGILSTQQLPTISYTNSTNSGSYSSAIGNYVKATATSAIALGSGTATTQLTNNTPKSLMIGFDGVSTLFVNGARVESETCGRVGIGTIAPAATLDVNGGINASKNICIGTTTIANDEKLTVNGNIGLSGTWNAIRGIDAAGALHINAASNAETGSTIELYGNNHNLFGGEAKIKGNKIKISGDTYIGDNSTTNNLYVNGILKVRKVEVRDESWSDFVFAPDYKLMSIEEVKAFISANGHLPSVPSEKEILENGHNLAEMDAILLQKIEELTLYSIEQNETIKELLSQIIEQNKRIENLEKRNTELEAKN